MTKQRHLTEFDPAHAKEHGYSQDDWDEVDSPELTAQELASMRPFPEAEPDLYASLVRSQASREEAPAPASIPINPDLLARLEASGPGWQRRVNDMIRTALDAA